MSNPSNVDTVLVDGEVIKRNGEFLEPEYVDLKDEFREASGRILLEAG